MFYFIVCFSLDWMMIYLNRNLHRKLKITLILIGTLLIKVLQLKIMDLMEQMVHHIPVMGLPGREQIFNKNFSIELIIYY